MVENIVVIEQQIDSLLNCGSQFDHKEESVKKLELALFHLRIIIAFSDPIKQSVKHKHPIMDYTKLLQQFADNLSIIIDFYHFKDRPVAWKIDTHLRAAYVAICEAQCHL